MSEGEAGSAVVHQEREVPVHKIRESFFDPSTWASDVTADPDITTTMRRMHKQMQEMERQMERMFEQFHRLEPMSAGSSRMRSGLVRFPGWWDDESMDSPWMSWRRGPRGASLWDSDLALPPAAPVSPQAELPRMMLRQSSRGAPTEDMFARQTSREPADVVPYHAPGELDAKSPGRVGQLGTPVIIDQAGNRKLRMAFDVRQFKPEEITVKTQDSKVMVRAVHKEESESNQVYREYQRMFTMPPEVKPETLESSLSPDGVLTLEAPMPSAIEPTKDTVIPIIHEKSANM